MMLFMITDIIILILLTNYFKFNYHPMIMSLTLIIFTLFLISKMLNLMSNFMYMYIIFLLMIGGIMILILYLTSISNNELITFSTIKMTSFMKLILIYLWIMFFPKYLLDMNIMFNEFNNFILFKNLLNKFDMLFFMIIYLFIIMITSILICLKNNKPLRQIN